MGYRVLTSGHKGKECENITVAQNRIDGGPLIVDDHDIGLLHGNAKGDDNGLRRRAFRIATDLFLEPIDSKGTIQLDGNPHGNLNVKK